jgi:hypothetical protein
MEVREEVRQGLQVVREKEFHGNEKGEEQSVEGRGERAEDWVVGMLAIDGLISRIVILLFYHPKFYHGARNASFLQPSLPFSPQLATCLLVLSIL